MKFLTVIGTAAMFLVGGGIVTHGIPMLHHGIEDIKDVLTGGSFSGLLELFVPMLLNALAGLVTGFACWVFITAAAKFRGVIAKMQA